MRRRRQLIEETLEPYGGDLTALLRGCARGTREERINAMGAASRLKLRAAAPVLLSILKDSKEEVAIRRAAAGLIGELADRRTIGQLRRLLRGGDSPIIREHAAVALRWTRSPEAVPELLAALQDPLEDVRVRREVAEALASCKEPACLPVLIDGLRDSEPEIRFWCAFALGEIGDAAAISELERVAAGDFAPVSHCWAPTVAEQARGSIEAIRRAVNGR